MKFKVVASGDRTLSVRNKSQGNLRFIIYYYLELPEDSAKRKLSVS
jgi:hypothetical protein